MKVRTEARRAAIIKEALMLFCEMGFERASMSQLSKRLGGSKATLYGYFDSKESLLLAVVKSMSQGPMDSVLQDLSKADSSELGKVLQGFAEVMVKLINTPQATAVYRMVISEAGRTEAGQLFYDAGPKRVQDELSRLLQRAVDNQTLKPCDTHVAAQQLVALIRAETEGHLFMLKPIQLTETQRVEVATRAVTVFMQFYGAP